MPYLSLFKPDFLLKKYLQLAAQIVRNGTLRSNGQNFTQNRAKSLENLHEFIPDLNSLHHQKSSGNNVIGQAAFIKSSFQKKGGHLRTGNLGYIRIPKSANTSISYAMLIKRYPRLKDKNPDEYQINFLTDTNLKLVSESGAETFFTVVRNPFARLVSVYRDFFETSHPNFIYTDYLFGILPQHITFAEFVSRISRIPDRLKDQHFKPQHLFIEPYEAKRIAVNIIQLENSFSLAGFMEQHGMELLHRNKSRGAYDYTQYYTPSVLARAYDIYKTDIKKFGYLGIYEELKARVNH